MILTPRLRRKRSPAKGYLGGKAERQNGRKAERQKGRKAKMPLFHGLKAVAIQLILNVGDIQEISA